ncbi:uncharacterized protein I303_100155 [Kwoniella dejecticola CBS 10117]|uniref:Uncharacterized protein n=1 Tax=Kwoniella dejecticola CBS 10117 TaxID=1296121 RepID=A0A1A6AE74_9TREE|nr:uncharacterized protein I303_00155 [Kwoniella dejecticola CBS 10117]OBR88344.1 hypothetical protein I303_00155 [Kwoniella dejecticola CBS 10117]
MLPTQPINCGKSWWGPHMDYHMSSRFAWPTPPPPVAEAAAATGALGAGLGAAEGAAASNLASHATAAGAGAGAGGIPPRGPWGYHHHYYNGYGRYGRRFGRGPRGGRLFWLLIGVGGTAWYFKHQEHKKEHERRLIEGTGLSLSQSQSPMQAQSQFPSQTDSSRPAWGWNRQCGHRQLGSPPTSAFTAGISSNQDQADHSVSTATNGEDEKMAWGWGSWKERKLAREEAWRKARAQAQQEKAQFQVQVQEPLVSSSPTQNAETQAPTMSQRNSSNTSHATDNTAVSDGGEMNKIKEAVEKLWEEKKRDALLAQENANDKAKEYARDKLDKLSAALETLRESLKVEAQEKAQKADKKWV